MNFPNKNFDNVNNYFKNSNNNSNYVEDIPNKLNKMKYTGESNENKNNNNENKFNENNNLLNNIYNNPKKEKSYAMSSRLRDKSSNNSRLSVSIEKGKNKIKQNSDISKDEKLNVINNSNSYINNALNKSSKKLNNSQNNINNNYNSIRYFILLRIKFFYFI